MAISLEFYGNNGEITASREGATRSLPGTAICRSLAGILLLFSGTAFQLQAEEVLRPYSMPGRLVNIGTHRLHIHCTGEGTPAVIIDSGLGGVSLEWKIVQAGMAKYVRVCSYDRAGYGWSDPGPEPRTTQQITKELHALLINADIPPPYILVGHSFGGYNIRYFASTYPQNVAGLVLVDASHPDQVNRLPQRNVNKKVTRPENSWTVRLAAPVISDNYPAESKQHAYVLMAGYKAAYTQMQEWDNFMISSQQVTALNNLPDVPLTVISRGRRVWPDTPQGDEAERVWSELQDELCQLTGHSVHIIAAQSGHLVHLDQPDLVINSVLKTVVSANEFRIIRIAAKRQQLLLAGGLETESYDYGYDVDSLFGYPWHDSTGHFYPANLNSSY